MPLRVADAVRCDPVEVRRLDRTAVAAERGEADIVEDDLDDVGRAVRRLRRLKRRPVRLRVPDVDVDRACKRCAHADPLSRWWPGADLRTAQASTRRNRGLLPRPSNAAPTRSSERVRTLAFRCKEAYRIGLARRLEWTSLESPVRQLVDDYFARAERSRHQSDASHEEREQHGRWRRVPSPVLALVQCPWQIQLPSDSLPFTVSAMYSPRVTLPLLSVKRCR